MKAEFAPFTHADYQGVCDFLVRLNQGDEKHINWNWARWEWMYCHTYTDRENMNAVGLWKCGGEVVGAAIYDMFFGEAFCAAAPGHEELLPEIYAYALRELSDENGLAVAVNDADEATAAMLTGMGWQKCGQTESIMCCKLESKPEYTLTEGFFLKETHFSEDYEAYLRVIWKGFGHEGDMEEWERMVSYDGPPHPHREPCLSISAVDKAGEFAAHCTCWYDRRTDYAYVEPVCTVPAHRGKGLGRAVVLEALERCRLLGARRAFVISDQEFYARLGFEAHSRCTFYRKNSGKCSDKNIRL